MCAFEVIIQCDFSSLICLYRDLANMYTEMTSHLTAAALLSSAAS